MKAFLRVGAFIMILAYACVNSGCYTAYQAVRDERDVKTFARDKTIGSKIKYQLLADDSVKGLDIAVRVYEGKVFLIGAVDSATQRGQAKRLARRVDGVRSVTTYLLDKTKKQKGQTADDLKIAATVKKNLIADKELKSTQIEVKSVLGHVVLTGIVGSVRDKNKAIKHAKNVEGVKKVKSFLIVQ